MTNTKFRKRALLSSVAMLLVALVALGSATFAWFSTNNKATAKQITATTNKASNILLSEDGENDWGTDITFAGAGIAAGAMEPITTADMAAWKRVLADEYNGGLHEDSYVSGDTVSSPGTSDYKHTKLYIQSVGADKTISLKINFTDAQGKDYLRVGLVPMAISTTNKTTGAFSATNHEKGAANIIWGNAQDDWAADTTDGWNAAYDATTNPYNSAVTDTTATIVLGAATADLIYGFDVYVWYEGTDDDCKDQYSGTNLSVDFEVTGA